MPARRPSRRWMLVGLLFFSGLFLTLPPAAAETLLVVPFENAARASDLEWLGESFAEALNARLPGNGYLVVTREERLAALERLGLPPAAPLTQASLLRLGEEVGADWVILGSYTVEGEELRSQARLLGVRSLTLSPWLEETGSFARLLDLQGELAWRILCRLDPTFPLGRDAFMQRFPRLRTSAFESYVRGLLAMSRGQQQRYFLQANRLEPAYAAPVFRLAQSFFEDMDYATAARWFAKVPTDDPLALDARFYLSLCHYYLSEFVQAAEALAPLAERIPSASVLNNLGVFASRAGDDGAAVANLKRALESDPADPDVYFNFALHHLRQHRWEEAVQSFERCLELSPGDTQAHLLLAAALERLGRKEEAELARRQAGEEETTGRLDIERDALDLDRPVQRFNARAARRGAPRPNPSPDPVARTEHVSVHLERGEDLLARGELEQAKRELFEAILLDPASARAHYLLAAIYQRRGLSSEAIAELKASLWSQETVGARLRLAEIYFALERLEEAQAEVQAALALDPVNQDARALEARLALRRAGEGKAK